MSKLPSAPDLIIEIEHLTAALKAATAAFKRCEVLHPDIVDDETIRQHASNVVKHLALSNRKARSDD